MLLSLPHPRLRHHLVIANRAATASIVRLPAATACDRGQPRDYYPLPRVTVLPQHYPLGSGNLSTTRPIRNNSCAESPSVTPIHSVITTLPTLDRAVYTRAPSFADLALFLPTR